MSGLWPCGIGLSCRGLRRDAPANNALQLPRRRSGACQGYQPAGGRVRGALAGRPPEWHPPGNGRRAAERGSVSLHASAVPR
jgi:hypothetical protein